MDEEKKDLLGKGYLEVEKERIQLKEERKQRLRAKEETRR